MAVPTERELYRPVLEIAAETGKPMSLSQFVELLTTRLSLSEEDLRSRVSTGAPRVNDRTSWAQHKLLKAGLLHRPSRGRYQITIEGRSLVARTGGDIIEPMLNRMVLDRQAGDETPVTRTNIETDDDVTPAEKMADGYKALRAKLTDDLLESLSKVTPDLFEQLVVVLLEKMGYGKGDVVGGSGDGGIDGIINQDALGLEKVYIQAKRWASQVGEPEIRNFSGSLDARGASKGVFITTSRFSETASRTAHTISAGNKFIRLIDGAELASLMIDHDVGVITETTYKVKKLDENYFAEEF